MKGKSLFLLINELNKAERHQLLNTCKRSGDKRHNSLYQLVKRSTGVKDTFEQLLDQCAKPLYGNHKSEGDQDKIQRRFIDFSIKEIESIKLRNFLAEDQLLRHYLLMRIYEGKGDETIEGRYLEKTGELAIKGQERVFEAIYLDRKIAHTSRTHTKKEIFNLRDLLVQKNQLIQKDYHCELARIYDLLSFLNFEDKESVSSLKELILSDEEVNALVTLASGSPEEVDYLVARARFSFYKQDEFNHLIQPALAAVKKIRNEREKERLVRKIAFVRTLNAFQFGAEPAVLLELSEPLKTSPNGKEVFYFHLFRILDLHHRKKPLPEAREINKLKMEAENEFRTQFLLALIAFLHKDYGQSLRKLNELAYSTNFQLATWSRMMEFRIHMIKGNYSLCDSLGGRITRHFQGNKGKEFTLDSSKLLFTVMNEEMKVKAGKAKPVKLAMTCLHRAILNEK
jgi:hypothetical protein